MSALYAVMGHPIEHSRSPEIHRRFALQFDVAMEYRKIEARGGSLAEALERFAGEGGRGCNITVPIKEEAARLCDVLGAEARQAGAANTLTLREDGSARGDNTDGLGLLRHLRANLAMNLEGARVLMIGAGGAARGVAPALLSAGIAEIAIVNRTRERSAELARRFAALGRVRILDPEDEDLPEADLVINASSAGMSGQSPGLPPAAAAGSVCVDLAYGPAALPFLSWARQGKARSAHDGWGMLVEQAAESFRIWHGRRPDTEELIRGGGDALTR